MTQFGDDFQSRHGILIRRPLCFLSFQAMGFFVRIFFHIPLKNASSRNLHGLENVN